MLAHLCTWCAMQAVLSRNSSYEDSVRWARCLSEIVKQAGQLCNESAKAAYVEVSSRLQVSKALPLSSLATPFWEEACQSMLPPTHASSMSIAHVHLSECTAAAYPESGCQSWYSKCPAQPTSCFIRQCHVECCGWTGLCLLWDVTVITVGWHYACRL